MNDHDIRVQQKFAEYEREIKILKGRVNIITGIVDDFFDDVKGYIENYGFYGFFEEFKEYLESKIENVKKRLYPYETN